MPTKGIYTALSGAIAHGERLDTIANNIANVNTPAFKRDQQIFREYLSANEKIPEVLQVGRIPSSVESFYDMQGAEKSYVENNGTYTDFSQGAVKATGQPLDFAINGKGLFEVLTPQGVRFTRNGAFKLDGNGLLVNSDGHQVLRQAEPGTNPALRIINLADREVHVNGRGEIFKQRQKVGTLSVVNVGNVDALKKIGTSLYALKDNQDAQMSIDNNHEIRQGYLETSNVNIVKEMTDMINASRVFESTQKAIKAYDQMNQKLVNEVPKLG